MSQFIVTLQSQKTRVGALGVVDSELGLRYLQIDKKPSLVRSGELRGAAVLDERLYVVTPASLRIMQVRQDAKAPVFSIEREVSLPEWLCGGDRQADILPLMVSSSRQRVYLASNGLASIEVFDLNGEFIERRSLWEISPEYFRLPVEARKYYPYGHIRSIVESPQGRILATVASTNIEKEGVVVDIESGEVVLEKLATPHGSLFVGDRFVVQDVRAGVLNIYKDAPGSNVYSEKLRTLEPRINNPDYMGSIQNLRGILQLGNEIFSGVCNFDAGKMNQIPPRIVAFNIDSGAQTREIFLPDFRSFRMPRVFSMSAAPAGLNLPAEDGVILFRHGRRHVFQPELKGEPGESATAACKADNVKCDPVEHKHAEQSVRVDKVSLAYRRAARFWFGANRQLRKGREFWALRDVSFTIAEGEVVGLIGRNGSGKSTLGMLINGSMQPDKGNLETKGRVQLLSLGLGFQSDLSGRQNALISGTLLGLTRTEMLTQMGEIESFSELGEFIDEPVRTYSAGMKSRLAFAVATIVRPDILILDEILSTGDQAFRSRAEARMRAMRAEARTVIMVSHNGNQLKKLCTRMIWLEKGCMMMDGEPKKVLNEYNHFCQNPGKWVQRHSDV